MVATALSIAGSDPSGGAGIQADLKTFHQHRVNGAAVVALLTAQNNRGVSHVEVIDARTVALQLSHAIFGDGIRSAKTGALGTAGNVAVVVEEARKQAFPWVVDPVLAASSGAVLLDDEGRAALAEQLIPLSTLVTPNVPEAEWLTGRAIRTLGQAKEAAEAIGKAGPSVLLKGGHLLAERDEVVDVLFHQGELQEFRGERLALEVRGTGCALSAAITARLAGGQSLPEAVALGRQWLVQAIATAVRQGDGVPPVNHFCELPSETC